MKFERRENLDTLVVRNNSHRAVILNHGYGANMEDLAPLGDVLGRDYDWYFPEGPVKLDNRGLGGGRPCGWFPLQMDVLETAFKTENFELLLTPHFQEAFQRAEDGMGAFVENVKKSYDSLVLGGFSQGAMVALGAGLKHRNIVDKLLIFSGLFVSKNAWSGYEGEIKSFQSHGKSDPLLPYSQGEALCEFLTSLNPEHRFVAHEGGHEIPLDILREAKVFLNDEND